VNTPHGTPTSFFPRERPPVKLQHGKPEPSAITSHDEESLDAILARLKDDGCPLGADDPPDELSSFIPEEPVSSLNRKESAVAKPVYPVLAAHQRAEKDWDFHPLYARLDPWWGIIDAAFDLHLPRTVLRLDPRIRTNCAGYFRPGHNEFGMEMEIAIAVPPREELDAPHDLDFGDMLGTLAHEMLHLEQQLNGSPGSNNYHNRQYQRKAATLGLLVDSRGHQTYDPDGPFIALLRRHGVELPLQVQMMQALAAGLPLPPVRERRKSSRSKLRKWTCGCQNAWVGAREFVATCGLCNARFSSA
jgi:hypothetical protein